MKLDPGTELYYQALLDTANKKNTELQTKLKAAEERNNKLKAFIKHIHAKGFASSMAIARQCDIPYKEVVGWYEDSRKDR